MSNWVWQRTANRAAGFTLIETMLVTGVATVVASMAALSIGNARPGMVGDGGMRVVMAQLNTARELAITQRRYMRVDFLNGNTVAVTRQNVPNGTTVLSQVPLEGNVQFTLTFGVPDTPDAFGGASAVAFGTATSLRFSSDGMLVDQNGAPVNGTVFLALPSATRSARAVTVMGSTGRVRGYKWDGRRWLLV